uniref:Uncharacterized protein n=1 Tax=Oryza glumipatula TaxID=40148 RepID=A0A0E0ATV4_9ORYZ
MRLLEAVQVPGDRQSVIHFVGLGNSIDMATRQRLVTQAYNFLAESPRTTGTTRGAWATIGGDMHASSNSMQIGSVPTGTKCTTILASS